MAEMLWVVSISRHLEGTTEDWPTKQKQEFHVSDGLPHDHISIGSLMWVIITSVGTLLRVLRIMSGAGLMMKTFDGITALFHFAPH